MSSDLGFKKTYKGLKKSFQIYWSAYGGWAALITSPYFHAALILSIISCPVWSDGAWQWYDKTLSVIPNVLGFTLGGYAILLAFGDKEFMQKISGADADGSKSPFMAVNGTFVHFVMVQVLALLMALICSIWEIKKGVFAFAGIFLLFYSILIAAAAVMAILRVARWFDIYSSDE